ncbi:MULTISPECIES: hypothetical protein [Streptomyces]|uniref:hypothetical protein n=1 Tax=Streptomyces TaxID=1883 RepID=UPI0036965C2B
MAAADELRATMADVDRVPCGQQAPGEVVRDEEGRHHRGPDPETRRGQVAGLRSPREDDPGVGFQTDPAGLMAGSPRVVKPVGVRAGSSAAGRVGSAERGIREAKRYRRRRLRVCPRA